MSLQLVHNKDTLSCGPISAPLEDTTSYHAMVVAHHRAPDVYEMIFGTTALPRMNKTQQQRHLKVVA